MAASKVVITTAAGIKGIEAKAGSTTCWYKSRLNFARTIKWCLENKEAAEKMAAKACRLIKETYEHGKVIQRVITELEFLLHKRRN